MVRVAIYCRISLDRKEGAGVARQLADCRALAAERGWEVVAEHVDNDVSAYRAKRRPEWRNLLRGLEDGDYEAVVAYHPDRLYRRLADLATFVDVVKAAGAEVATVRAGDIDLSTASGRMVAGMLGSAAVYESERMAERVARAKKERAAQGKPPGGGRRPFGWRADGITPEPREFDALRAAAESVAAGGTVGAAARQLRERGFTTTYGRPWDTKSLTRVLRSARIAGLREYQNQILGPAAWPGVVDEPTWRRLRMSIDSRKGTRGPRQPTLLSGLITCPNCGCKLYYGIAKTPAYKCSPATRQGCGRSSISQAAADAKVLQVVRDWLDDPTIEPVTATPTSRAVDTELDALAAMRRDITEKWARGLMDDDDYEAGLKIIAERIDELDQPTPAGPPVLDIPLLLQALDEGTVEEQRAVVESVVERITLLPGRMKDPQDRVQVETRQ